MGFPKPGRFRQRFSARFGEREVPVLEALDEESGVGFESAAEHSPLVAGLDLPEPPGKDSVGPRERALLALLSTTLRHGERVFAIAGSSHAVKLEAALRSVLQPADDREGSSPAPGTSVASESDGAQPH